MATINILINIYNMSKSGSIFTSEEFGSPRYTSAQNYDKKSSWTGLSGREMDKILSKKGDKKGGKKTNKRNTMTRFLRLKLRLIYTQGSSKKMQIKRWQKDRKKIKSLHIKKNSTI